MEFVEVMKQRGRMCRTLGMCQHCPLYSGNNGINVVCHDIIIANAEKAEEIIMKWAEENPVNTNGSHFLEEFPKAFVSGRKYNSDNTMMVFVRLNLPSIEDDGIYFPAEWWDEEYKGVHKDADNN